MLVTCRHQNQSLNWLDLQKILLYLYDQDLDRIDQTLFLVSHSTQYRSAALPGRTGEEGASPAGVGTCTGTGGVGACGALEGPAAGAGAFLRPTGFLTVDGAA